MSLVDDAPIYEVFGQRDALSFATYVGSVRAASLELALLLARETYFRREKIFDMWVVPKESVTHARAFDATLLMGSMDKEYRLPSGYDNAPIWKQFKAQAQTIEEVALDVAPPARSSSS